MVQNRIPGVRELIPDLEGVVSGLEDGIIERQSALLSVLSFSVFDFVWRRVKEVAQIPAFDLEDEESEIIGDECEIG